MQPNDTNQLQSILKRMVELELTIAELYRTCSQTWASSRTFWSDLEQAEVRHAGNINRMIKIISERPGSFELGRQIKPAAVQTSIAGIQWHLQRLRRKEMTESNMLFIGSDIEQTILEKNYSDIVKTNDAEFQLLLNEIVSDTEAHREVLNKRIGEVTLQTTHKHPRAS